MPPVSLQPTFGASETLASRMTTIPSPTTAMNLVGNAKGAAVVADTKRQTDPAVDQGIDLEQQLTREDIRAHAAEAIGEEDTATLEAMASAPSLCTNGERNRDGNRTKRKMQQARIREHKPRMARAKRQGIDQDDDQPDDLDDTDQDSNEDGEDQGIDQDAYQSEELHKERQEADQGSNRASTKGDWGDGLLGLRLSVDRNDTFQPAVNDMGTRLLGLNTPAASKPARPGDYTGIYEGMPVVSVSPPKPSRRPYSYQCPKAHDKTDVEDVVQGEESRETQRRRKPTIERPEPEHPDLSPPKPKGKQPSYFDPPRPPGQRGRRSPRSRMPRSLRSPRPIGGSRRRR